MARALLKKPQPQGSGKKKGLSPQAQMAVIALAVFAAIVLVGAQTLKPQLDNPKFVAKEAPLFKNTNLVIAPGESYSYEYRVWNESANLSYLVLGGNNCTVIRLIDGQGAVCVDRWGNDASGQNASYSVPVIVLMRPWMLAVTDSWRWNVSNYISFGSLSQHVVDTNYTTIRTEYYRGRRAYVVKVESSDGDTAVDWVDAEKRILLREAGADYEIVLTGGLPLSD